MNASSYCHKQKSLFWLFPVSLSVITLSIGALSAHVGELTTALFLCGLGGLLALVGLSFQHLVMLDQGDSLAVRFGPLPLFCTKIPYASIQKVEPFRLPFVGGLRRGVYWTLWGRNCVLVSRRNGALCLGTDDSTHLTAFLKEKMNQNDSGQEIAG